MDEIITEERRENLKKLFITTADADALTNEDALKIIDILQNALERQKNDMYEKLIIEMIKDGSEE